MTDNTELKGLSRQNDASLLSFCRFFLGPGVPVDDLVVQIFKKFGDQYRARLTRKAGVWESHDLQVRLFQLAWKVVQKEAHHLVDGWIPGRDTRLLQKLETNLLDGWTKKHQLDDSELSVRMGMIDLEFRAPVILRDILQFPDEEALRILGLRWGVYRHRLHRGRLALMQGLKGTRHLC